MMWKNLCPDKTGVPLTVFLLFVIFVTQHRKNGQIIDCSFTNRNTEFIRAVMTKSHCWKEKMEKKVG